jgi:branched-subunit amino acid transport protein
MALVTYIPRLVPFVALRSDALPPFVRRFLSLLPVAALGALIFPDGVSAVAGRPVVSFAAIAVAALLSVLRLGMVASVLGGVGVAWLLLVLM